MTFETAEQSRGQEDPPWQGTRIQAAFWPFQQRTFPKQLWGTVREGMVPRGLRKSTAKHTSAVCSFRVTKSWDAMGNALAAFSMILHSNHHRERNASFMDPLTTQPKTPCLDIQATYVCVTTHQDKAQRHMNCWCQRKYTSQRSLPNLSFFNARSIRFEMLWDIQYGFY